MKKKILIADDDQLTTNLVAKKLEKLGYACEVVYSGMDCIAKNDSSDFDLVLLDMMMPDMDGLETLKQLRVTYSAMDLPVIVMTASEKAEEGTIKSLQAGANDFIQKPVNIDIADARIKTHTSVAELYSKSLAHQQLETINAMITTYNHEINNPLAIAIGLLQRSEITNDEGRFAKIMDALNRIRDIVVKIRNLEDQQVEVVEYTKHSKMIKIK